MLRSLALSKKTSLWSLQVIPMMGKISFRVLFLPTEEGSIESSLFINTSSHGVLSYQVTTLLFSLSFGFTCVLNSDFHTFRTYRLSKFIGFLIQIRWGNVYNSTCIPDLASLMITHTSVYMIKITTVSAAICSSKTKCICICVLKRSWSY